MAGAVARGARSPWRVRPARAADLAGINGVVERAIATWRVADRVRRLSLPVLRYSRHDLEHMALLVATDADDAPVAVAAWETPSAGSDEAAATDLHLHGLYVTPEHQSHGIGGLLLRHAEDSARRERVPRITLLAWRGAEPFFRKRGFRPEGTACVYPRRLHKRLRGPRRRRGTR